MYRRRVILFIGFAASIAVLGHLARPFVSLDAANACEQWLREATLRQPVIAVGIAFVAYVLLTLIPGLAGKSVVFGWLLGFLPGLLVVNGGLTVAALIMFLLSRHLLRDAVECRFGWFIERLNRSLCERGSSYLLLLRLLHAPFTVTNYAAGATDIPLRRFWWTTQFGLLPGNVAFVLAGASLPSLNELAERGLWSFVNLPLFIGLTLMGLLPVTFHWFAGGRRPFRHEVCGEESQQNASTNDRGRIEAGP